MGEKKKAIEKEKYMDQWILICDGKIVAHSSKIGDILDNPEHEGHNPQHCYIEKVTEGQVCFY